MLGQVVQNRRLYLFLFNERRQQIFDDDGLVSEIDDNEIVFVVDLENDQLIVDGLLSGFSLFLVETYCVARYESLSWVVTADSDVFGIAFLELVIGFKIFHEKIYDQIINFILLQ